MTWTIVTRAGIETALCAFGVIQVQICQETKTKRCAKCFQCVLVF